MSFEPLRALGATLAAGGAGTGIVYFFHWQQYYFSAFTSPYASHDGQDGAMAGAWISAAVMAAGFLLYTWSPRPAQDLPVATRK